ncbi:hypothetical protein CRM22_000457 [Opisthorchis felineus]|uniref:DRBM domain-containing protein n=1 Tax=Opisthorchis felineus TaxID=147828 RepID=A0A4S2MEZ3_OPIFE|nr:hypothetical protein CRM22_000457 [Opisthorchis felineus]
MSKASLLTTAKEIPETPLSLFHKLTRRHHIRISWNLVDEYGAPHSRMFLVKLTIFTEGSQQPEVFEAVGRNIQAAKQSVATTVLENSPFFKSLLAADGRRQRSQARDEKYQCFRNLIDDVPSAHGPRNDILELTRVINVPAKFLRLHGSPTLTATCDQKSPAAMYRVALEMVGRQYVGESTSITGAEQEASVAALKAIRRVLTSSATFVDSEHLCPSQLGQRLRIRPTHPIWKLQLLVGLHHERPTFRTFWTPVDDTLEEPRYAAKAFYQCICSVPSLGTVECIGKSKAMARTSAAKLMLDRLIQLSAHGKPEYQNHPTPFLSRSSVLKSKSKNPPTKARSQFKVDRINPTYGQDVNPVQRLDYFCLAQALGRPVYVLVHDGTSLSTSSPAGRMTSHHVPPEFAYEVRVGTRQTVGPRGRNKRLARRMAAEVMLEMLGFQRPKSPQVQSALRSTDCSSVQHTSEDVSTVGGASNSSPFSSLSSHDAPSQNVADGVPPVISYSQQRHVEFSCTHDVLILDCPAPRCSFRAFGHQPCRSNRSSKSKSSSTPSLWKPISASRSVVNDVTSDFFSNTPIGHWSESEEAQTIGRCWPLRRTRSCSDLVNRDTSAVAISNSSSDPICITELTAMQSADTVAPIPSRSNLRLLAQLAVFYLEEMFLATKSTTASSLKSSSLPTAARLLLSLCQRFRVPCQFVDQAPPSSVNGSDRSPEAYQYNTVLSIGGSLPPVTVDPHGVIADPTHVIVVRASGRTLEDARHKAALSAFRQMAQEVQQ